VVHQFTNSLHTNTLPLSQTRSMLLTNSSTMYTLTNCTLTTCPHTLAGVRMLAIEHTHEQHTHELHTHQLGVRMLEAARAFRSVVHQFTNSLHTYTLPLRQTRSVVHQFTNSLHTYTHPLDADQERHALIHALRTHARTAHSRTAHSPTRSADVRGSPSPRSVVHQFTNSAGHYGGLSKG